MKSVSWLFVLTLGIMVSLSVVSADSLIFDYTSNSNGQLSVNGAYTWIAPGNMNDFYVSLMGPGYHNETGNCYDPEGFSSGDFFGGYLKTSVSVNAGQNALLKINQTVTSFSLNEVNLHCKSDGNPNISIARPAARPAAQTQVSLDRLCVEAGYNYSIGSTTQCWHAGCGGKGNMKVKWDGTNWISAHACEGNSCGYLTSVTCRKLDRMGSIILQYNSVTLSPFVPVVASVSSCLLNQTLFKLYQGGNSHVANASTSDALVPICYPDIFGTQYLGANPHACSTGNANVLLWGTSTQNAHAATITSLTYATPYCYGDLTCTVRGSFDQCTGTGRVVARLPAGVATSNLHVGNASFTPYDRVLCCASGGIPPAPLSTVIWTNTNGQSITTAIINQTVNITATTSLSSGIVTFTIKEKDSGIDDLIVTLQGTVLNGKATASWKINDTFISAGKDDSSDTVELTFYADASIPGNTVRSPDLQMSLLEGGTGYLLEGNITGIYHGQVYLNGSAIAINHTFNRGNALRSNWTIVEDGFTSETDFFAHNFTTPGQKTVMLHVRNNNGGHAERQIGVLVVPSSGGDGLMTFIDYPGYYQIIPTGRNPSTTFVAGANTSFAVVRNATACGALQCVGGKCPSVTNNTDPVCGNTLRNISAAPQPYGALRFRWEVYDDAGNWGVLQEGSGIVTTVLLMRDSAYSERRSSGPLNRLHDKQLRVTTNYTSGTTSLQSSFTRAFTLGQCLNRGETFAFVTNGQFVRFASTVSSRVSSDAPFEAAACKGEDGVNGTLDDCVPTGWKCGATGGGYFPVINATTPVFCDDFSTRAGCESASLYIPSQAICPGQSQSARCVWDTTRARCGTNYTISTLSGATTNMCLEFIDSKTECVEGLKDVTINSTLTHVGLVCQAFDDACQSRADTLVCGRPAFELPFFGWWQLVIGGLGIVVLGLLRRKVVTLK
ncbi:hypothetical protein EXS73_03515 [Candidatus Pacearchaeota archaeon]|nr:hypothetical protein [Candidatus Pacearchaeota archaeon]